MLIRPPAFWHDPRARVLPLLLSPLAWATGQATAYRLQRPGFRAPVPVLCCGNLGVGGAGKTTVALDLLRRLQGQGVAAHVLTRGYGGRVRGVLRVDQSHHEPSLVGDEALLLAACAPTWVAADRAASARAAIDAGAQCLVMDDGMQNPGLVQDCTLLVIDGEVGFGNRRLLPAGPLRESIGRGAARADAAILIGADRTEALRQLPATLPVLRARLEMAPAAAALRGRRLIAFAGIARPQKFFTALEKLGLCLVEQIGFPDHHPYSGPELDKLLRRAGRAGAQLVSTPKDAVRLPAGFREQVVVLEVGLLWDEEAIAPVIDRLLTARTATMRRQHRAG